MFDKYFRKGNVMEYQVVKTGDISFKPQYFENGYWKDFLYDLGGSRGCVPTEFCTEKGAEDFIKIEKFKETL